MFDSLDNSEYYTMDNTLDSTRVSTSSNTSTNSATSFLTTSSNSSVYSSYYQSSNKESLDSARRANNSQSSMDPSAIIEHSFSRNSDRSYNCYKPATTANAKTVSSLNTASNAPNVSVLNSNCNANTSGRPAYDNSSILNHHHSQQPQLSNLQLQHKISSYPSNDSILGSLSHNYNKTILYRTRTASAFSSNASLKPDSAADASDSNSSNSISTQAHPLGSPYGQHNNLQNQNAAPLVQSSQSSSTLKSTRSPQSLPLKHQPVPPSKLQPPRQAAPTHYFDISDPEDGTRTPKAVQSALPLKPKSSWRSWKSAMRKSPPSRSSIDEMPEELRPQSRQSGVSPSSSQQQRKQQQPQQQRTITPLPRGRPERTHSLSSQSTVSSRYSGATPAQQALQHQQPAPTSSPSPQQYGLMSKTEETRLRGSPEARQKFFENIQVQFLVCCSLQSRSHFEYASSITPSQTALADWVGFKNRLVNGISFASIEMSLKHLRDCISALPYDDLTNSVYVYSVQVSALEGHYESYVPSAKHVLFSLYPEGGISEHQFNDVMQLYILHLIHFENETVKVFDLLGEYHTTGENTNKMGEIVRVWVERDYLRWRQLYDGERNMARKRIMQIGELIMAKEALGRIGKLIRQQDLEATMGKSWERLLSQLNCTWGRDENDLIIIG